MNVKLKVNSVVRLIDDRVSMGQIFKKIEPFARQAKILLCEPQAGAGYLQWSMEGNDWVSFKNLNDADKADAAKVYHDRRQSILSQLQGAKYINEIFSVPDDEFIYFRKSGSTWDIALVAWAYRYPDYQAGSELDAWRSKVLLQDVRIGFIWDKKYLKNYEFKIENQTRYTSSDGWFELDRSVPVGSKYSIVASSGEAFTLTVEEGQSEYVYDLTRYFIVEVNVCKDNVPVSDSRCELMFDGISQTLTTDATGRAKIRLAMRRNATGNPADAQPECMVICMDKSESQTPKNVDETLIFNFDFETEKPEEEIPPVITEPEPDPEPDPEPEPEDPGFVTLTILDYEGYPLVDMPIIVTTKIKGDINLTTDHEGKCVIPKEYLTHKEKAKVRFTVTPEYQRTHDIHYYKSSKKK